MDATTRPTSMLDAYLDDARSAGAKAAEVLYIHRAGTRLEVRDGKVLHIHHPSGARVLGRVYLADGRWAPFSLESADRKLVAARIDEAVGRAHAAEPDPFAGPADRFPIATRGLGTDDVRFRDIQLEDREEVALINEEACSSELGVIPMGCTYEDQRLVRAFGSSRGVQAVSANTTYVVSLRARCGPFTLSLVNSARNFANVGSLPFGVDLARRLTALQGSEDVPRTPLPDEDLPLVLESRVLSWILERLGPAFSCRAVHRGKVFLANHIGQRIASPRVHLMDDAGLHGGLRTRAFDDRGVPPTPIPVIREGVQAGLYYDPESAREAGVRPTGHFLDGSLQPGNLILLSGNRSRTQMLSEVPQSLCFDHIAGKLDLRTGKLDVSGPAFLLERGRRVGVIEKVRLRTDVITLLSGVQEIASDQERYEAVDCATALIMGIPLAR